MKLKYFYACLSSFLAGLLFISIIETLRSNSLTSGNERSRSNTSTRKNPRQTSQTINHVVFNIDKVSEIGVWRMIGERILFCLTFSVLVHSFITGVVFDIAGLISK